jgi:hypothetical protein
LFDYKKIETKLLNYVNFKTYPIAQEMSTVMDNSEINTITQEKRLRLLSEKQYDNMNNTEKICLNDEDINFIKEALFIINKTNETWFTEWFGKYKIPSIKELKKIIAYRARVNITGETWGFQDQQTYGYPRRTNLSIAVPNAVFNIAYSKKNYYYDHYDDPLRFFQNNTKRL